MTLSRRKILGKIAVAGAAISASDCQPNAQAEPTKRQFKHVDISFVSTADFLLSDEKPQGAGTVTRAGHNIYIEAEGYSTDFHVQTASGVKHFVLPNDDGYNASAFGNLDANPLAVFNLAASILPSNSTLIIPAGNYTIDGEILFQQEGIKLKGYGAVIIQKGEFKESIRFDNGLNCHVRGLTLIGRGTEHDGTLMAYNGVAGIYIVGPKNATFEDITMYKHAGGGIRGKNFENVTFRNCRIEGIGKEGGIEALDNNGDVAIGSFQSSSDERILIENCNLSKHCFGVAFSRGEAISIVNTYIHDLLGQHGCYFNTVNDILITGTRFENIKGEAIKNQRSINGKAVSGFTSINNSMKNIGGTGIVLSPARGFTNTSQTGVYIDATNMDTVNLGIFIKDGEGIIGPNVSVNKTLRYGYFLEGFSGEVNGKISMTDWSGIYALVKDRTVIAANLSDCCLNSQNQRLHARTQFYALVLRYGTVTDAVEVVIDGLQMRNVLPLGRHVTNSIRTDSMGKTPTRVKNMLNLIGKNFRFETLLEFNPNPENKSLFSLSKNRNPKTPIAGQGRSHFYSAVRPTTTPSDGYDIGSICWNVAKDGPLAWKLTASGEVDTWTAFGQAII